MLVDHKRLCALWVTKCELNEFSMLPVRSARTFERPKQLINSSLN